MDRGEQLVVLIGVGQHRDVVVILGGGADQRGAADVDVLDGLFQWRPVARPSPRTGTGSRPPGRSAPCRRPSGWLRGRFAAGQDAAMNPGVQRLDPTAENLGLPV